MRNKDKRLMSSGKEDLDPLYVVFEQHLFNFQDSDINRKVFIQNVVEEYLKYLRRTKRTIPKIMETQVIEELSAQVNTMLVKKIYGCSQGTSLKDAIPATVKRRPGSRSSRSSKSRTKTS